MIKEFVYSIHFNHPSKPIGPKTGPQDTWSRSYPDRLEFKNIDSHLNLLKEKYGAIYADIITTTVEVDEDGYFDIDEAIEEDVYKWYDGKPITKTKEYKYDNQ